jgi:hypothetical protein
MTGGPVLSSSPRALPLADSWGRIVRTVPLLTWTRTGPACWLNKPRRKAYADSGEILALAQPNQNRLSSDSALGIKLYPSSLLSS